ncbi:MAG TPA: hypothetical protein DDY49_15270 [Paenibacillaceae bacterium]|nr:hypothetical protein [Paenibacillaceae bacterium]
MILNYHFQESLIDVLKEIKLELRTINTSLQAISLNSRQMPQNFEELINKLEKISTSLQEQSYRE